MIEKRYKKENEEKHFKMKKRLFRKKRIKILKLKLIVVSVIFDRVYEFVNYFAN